MTRTPTIIDGATDTPVVAEFERSRRAMTRRGLVLGGTVLAASSVPLLLGVRNAFAQTDGDAAIVEAAVGVEQVAVFVYTQAIDSGRLDESTLAVVRRFREQEQEHADELTSALRELGGKPPPKPTGLADVDAVKSGLGDARSQSEIASFAIELEMAGIAAYSDAHLKLKDARLLQTATSIMANEGQHLVVLRQLLRRPPVPNAFESGEAT